MNDTDIYIVAARRTPQGRFLGALSKYSAVELALAAGQAALENIDREKIDQVIVGNVLSAGQGMNIARQIGVKLDLPIEVPAFTVNMMCASGLQAIILAAQAIQSGAANSVLCGGTESMSNAPHILARSRKGYKLGDGKIIDTLLRDGLVDSFDNQHMGITAERLAKQYKISRAQQDEYAAQSQQRYGAAHAGGQFKNELVAVGHLDCDEHPRPSTTAESLKDINTAFKDKNSGGTVTPANASGINDGAAMLVVCSGSAAGENNWQPLAQITGFAAAGCDPKLMGLGPVYATRKLLKQNGPSAITDFDTIELNEAFAAQALACLNEFELPADSEKVNPHGGAIALGHPIGATGARLVTHLAHLTAQGQSKRSLATLCVGGGMGVAMALQTVH